MDRLFIIAYITYIKVHPQNSQNMIFFKMMTTPNEDDIGHEDERTPIAKNTKPS